MIVWAATTALKCYRVGFTMNVGCLILISDLTVDGLTLDGGIRILVHDPLGDSDMVLLCHTYMCPTQLNLVVVISNTEY